jgi:hypothetical protein
MKEEKAWRPTDPHRSLFDEIMNAEAVVAANEWDTAAKERLQWLKSRLAAGDHLRSYHGEE